MPLPLRNFQREKEKGARRKPEDTPDDVILFQKFGAERRQNFRPAPFSFSLFYFPLSPFPFFVLLSWPPQGLLLGCWSVRFLNSQLIEMFLRSRAIIIYALVFSLALLVCPCLVHAQGDEEVGDGEADPIKLFERGQDAHARGNLQLAAQLYAEAIKLRPEFPEAEYQRATALVSLNRAPEAEQGFRRAIELRPDWAQPEAALGALLVRLHRPDEAEKHLNRALELDQKSSAALVALVDLRLGTKAGRGVLQPLLERLRAATARAEATASLWVARASLERELGDKAEAVASLERALDLDPRNSAAHLVRAEMRAVAGDYGHAIEDAMAAQRGAYTSDASLLLARIYAQVGRKEEALRTLDALDEATKALPETVTLRNAILTGGKPDAESRAALEKILNREPRNAALLARLGGLYRTDDPARALEYYTRALEIEPRNADYATGYGAALVQAKRYTDAVSILRQVLTVAPDNYAAHANLAIALYESKRFAEALTEYRWIVHAKPELAAAYFFIATAHDNLGEYDEALAAYEEFLARADAQKNQTEIEKVNLRLPGLRNQIKRGEGKKKRVNSE
jgi:tetratricopeptide (TPR) repeat protein